MLTENDLFTEPEGISMLTNQIEKEGLCRVGGYFL